jgi:hypothetical protein
MRAIDGRAEAYFAEYIGERGVERNDADGLFSPAC